MGMVDDDAQAVMVVHIGGHAHPPSESRVVFQIVQSRVSLLALRKYLAESSAGCMLFEPYR
jgi:ribosomal protein L4